jgi:endo-alpha-1,4-polygalactosaminidase (GH114 family)
MAALNLASVEKERSFWARWLQDAAGAPIWLRLVFAVLLLAACNSGSPQPPVSPTATAGGQAPTSADTAIWQPSLHLTWQWQLTEGFDPEVEVQVYDLDLFDADPQVLAELKQRGKRLICYINVGAWEDWRPDRDQFPLEVLGNDYEGWPGERWLDIRHFDRFAPILQARFDLCAQKGFDAIEPDNIDAYTNDTGFPLRAEDQLAYNRWLAQEAHVRGLAIGLKNDPDQAEDLAQDFDWAMTEDCFAEGWCEAMTPFITLGKPVFATEYTDTDLDFTRACYQAQKLKFNLILKNRELDAFQQVCP